MKYHIKGTSVLLLSILLGACASTQLTREQMNQQYPTLVKLEQGLDKAKGDGIDLLAPNFYQKASDKYLDAYVAANDDQTDFANKSANSGLSLLKKANDVASKSRVILSEVLDARRRAMVAGAEKSYPEEIASNDKELVKVSTLIEGDSLEKAKKRRNDLQRSYTELELRALQKNTVAEAQSAINKAKENEAKKYAPKTLAEAEEQLVLAKSVLEVDRTNRDKASKHATRAKILANRSNQITTTIKDQNQRGFTKEDTILTFQSDLSKLGKTVAKDLQFDKPNKTTVANLDNDIKAFVESSAVQKSRIQELETKISATTAANDKNVTQLRKSHADELAKLNSLYSGEISVLGKSQQELQRLQREQYARFERIQNLFGKDEADVFRQKNNVLISVHGFKFPSGTAEIRPDNFELMNKIVKAINEFEGSKVVVSGHTDSTGTAGLNKTLSVNRAQSVAKFFVDVAGLEPVRIESTGFGQEKPVASNRSPDGRAKNRRVEILIVN